MKTRRSQKENAAPAPRNGVAIKKPLRVMGVRKPAACNSKRPAAAAATKRHTRSAAAAVTATGGSKRSASSSGTSIRSSARDGEAPDAKRKRTAGRTTPDNTCWVNRLDDSTLAEIFAALGNQKLCRDVLPLVCKRWASVLRLPSGVWKELVVDFTDKGMPKVPASKLLLVEGAPASSTGPANRRLLHSAVEAWLAPRASSVHCFKACGSALDGTHSFPTSGAGLQTLLSRVAATLRRLSIEFCSDVFNGNSLRELASLRRLEALTVVGVRGRLYNSDVEPLRKLGSLTELAIRSDTLPDAGSNNGFKSFPPALFKLKGLKKLAVSSPGITSLPVDISKLSALDTLDLSETGLKSLPRLAGMTLLTAINLNHTSVGPVIMDGDVFENMPIKELMLRSCGLLEVPEQLTRLTSLTVLDLSENQLDPVVVGAHAFDHLPGIASLQMLGLESCLLSSVPPAVSKLHGLHTLTLRGNCLVDLPSGFSEGLSRLTALDLSLNHFPRLPEQLLSCSGMRHLDISHNLYLEVTDWELLKPIADTWDDVGDGVIHAAKVLGPYQDFTCEHFERLAAKLLRRHGREVLHWKPRPKQQ